MKRLTLTFEKKSYDIVISDSFDLLKEELYKVCKGKVLLVTDTNVLALYKEEVQEIITKAGIELAGCVSFDAGEKSKNIDTLQKIYEACIEHELDRNSTIIALGGGVVGDMSGFAAATYMRGINFVQVPTTLLAQTDSSVGGKVGIDFCGAKNIVGNFKQPSLVYINTSTLKTLPNREFSAGMAEVIKYGYIKDSEFLSFLEKEHESICALDSVMVEKLIYNCCKIKADVVMQDEEEKSIRAILNFGHTIGHGVESAKNFELIHGECVALGMIAAIIISVKREWIDASEIERIKDILKKYSLMTKVMGVNTDEIIGYMKKDKKKLNSKLRFVLLQDIGKAIITDDVSDEEIMISINAVM